MRTSYLGCAVLGQITPINIGDITDTIFIEVTNADVKDGFVIEYEGVCSLYNQLMRGPERFEYKINTRNQVISVVNNYELTELTIELKEGWKGSDRKDVKELEAGLQVEIPDKLVVLLSTPAFIKKLFKIITAKERNLFSFS